MSSMMRKIARNIARTAMKADHQQLFGKYIPVETKVRWGHTDKFRTAKVPKSYFAREWRSWL